MLCSNPLFYIINIFYIYYILVCKYKISILSLFSLLLCHFWIRHCIYVWRFSRSLCSMVDIFSIQSLVDVVSADLIRFNILLPDIVIGSYSISRSLSLAELPKTYFDVHMQKKYLKSPCAVQRGSMRRPCVNWRSRF